MHTAPHPLEDAMPLPRTSNMQVLEPIQQFEGWDANKAPAGTRGYGQHTALDLYGNERAPLPVPKTLKMMPATEANERYAAIEDPVRRNLKTMSATNMQMGGIGIGGRDPTRGFLLHPQECNFGRVCVGSKYVMRLTLMNGGIDGSRFQVRKPKGVEVRYKTGMVAAGMSIVLQVVLSRDQVGTLDEQIQIVTENEVFRLPLSAAVLAEDEFNSLDQNQRTRVPEYKEAARAPPMSRAAPVVETAEETEGGVVEGEDEG